MAGLLLRGGTVMAKKSTIKVKWLMNVKIGTERFKRGQISDVKKVDVKRLEEKGYIMPMEIIEEEPEAKEG